MKNNISTYLRWLLIGIKNPFLLYKRCWYITKRTISGCLYRYGYCNYYYKIIFLAGMALGGSTWMKQLLAGIPGVFTRSTPMPYDIAYRQNICDSAFSRIPKHGNTLIKTHLSPTQENIDCLFRNEVEKVLVIYRDLRDVIISHYYRLIEFPKPKDAYDYKNYEAMGREEALNDLIEHTAEDYIPWIKGWFEIAKREPQRYHFTKFEDLKKDTKGEFKKVLGFYNIKLSNKKIDKIIEAARGRGNMKSNLLKAKILPSGIVSNFRSGKVGQWKTELSDVQKKNVRSF